MAKEKREIVPKEERETWLMGLARGLAKSIFVEPTRFAAELDDIGISDNDPIGVGSLQSFVIELELAGVSDVKERRAIATTATGVIKKGNLTGLFPFAVSLQTITLSDGTEIFYRSDFAKKNDREKNVVLRRYEAYKELLDKALEEKRLPQRQRREHKEAAARKEREEKEAAIRKERAKSPLGIIHFFSYRPGETAMVREIISRSEETFKAESDFEDAIFHELSDPTTDIRDVFWRLLPQQMVKRILDQGIVPEEFDRLVTAARERLVSAMQDMEAHIDGKTIRLIADVNQTMSVGNKHFVFPIPVHRSLSPFLHASFTYLNPDTENIMVEPDFGPRYPNMSFIDGTVHRWAFRYERRILATEREFLEAHRKEPAAAILLKALDEDNPADIHALRRGETIVVNGIPISLADLDRFIAEVIFEDEFLITAIFADVLGEIFMPARVSSPDAKEFFLHNISSYARLLVATEEIRGILLPEAKDDQAGIVIDIPALDEQIKEKENAIKAARGKPNASQGIVAWRKEIKALQRNRVVALASMRKVTKGDTIKDFIGSRIPQVEPMPRNYQGGQNSNAYRAAMRQYEQLSKDSDYFAEPDPADYEGGEQAGAYFQDAIFYDSFKMFSKNPQVKRSSDLSLLPEFSF